MQSEEQHLIDGLFSRLKGREPQRIARDASAEERIAGHIKATVRPLLYGADNFDSEAAIKQLRPYSGAGKPGLPSFGLRSQAAAGFSPACLAAGQSRGSDRFLAQSSMADSRPAPSLSTRPQAQQQNYAPQASRSSSGLWPGALQTAASVAGGVVLGNMLTNMFNSSHPREIVNIIEDKPAAGSQPGAGQQRHDDTFRQDDGQFLADNNDYDSDFDAGFGNDDFGSDDDSWV